MTAEVKAGLEGVIAAQTRLSSVNGQLGELVIGGFRLEEFANRASFEEVVYLLWYDALPNEAQLMDFRQKLAAQRALPEATLALLEAAAAEELPPMDALRMGAASLSLGMRANVPEDEGLRAVAAAPTMVAAYWRLLHGQQPIAPSLSLSHAENYLYMLLGHPVSPERSRAIETYFNTVIDHGLNASTFTARVIVSTRSDLISAIVGAIGALKGPLHGGAPGPALDMVFEIAEEEVAEPYLRDKLENGERLMGFGHRVYKVRDPRAAVLSAAAQKLYQADGDMALYQLARHVEETAVELLAEYKPGRKLQTNVEFYTALLLHGIGLDSQLFSATFAIGRMAGWVAHCLEQLRTGRLIRPKAAYIGVKDRRWEKASR